MSLSKPLVSSGPERDYVRNTTSRDSFETSDTTSSQEINDYQRDPRLCYINTSEDLHCLTTSSGGTIIRILRSVDQVEVPPKYGKLILSQIFQPGSSDKWFATNSLMTSSIKKLDGYWLAKECEQSIVVKEGEVSPRINGRIQVALFNKSDETIVIPKNSAVAQFVTKLYPYSSTSPPKYTLF